MTDKLASVVLRFNEALRSKIAEAMREKLPSFGSAGAFDIQCY
jgi:hypothetical protein